MTCQQYHLVSLTQAAAAALHVHAGRRQGVHPGGVMPGTVLLYSGGCCIVVSVLGRVDVAAPDAMHWLIDLQRGCLPLSGRGWLGGGGLG